MDLEEDSVFIFWQSVTKIIPNPQSFDQFCTRKNGKTLWALGVAGEGMWPLLDLGQMRAPQHLR